MIHVFISGPIRPSIADVLTCLRPLKSQLPPCKIWFSTWETDVSLDELRKEVDVLIVKPEPTIVPDALTREAGYFPEPCKGQNARIFKMFCGIEHIFASATCDNNDIVIRTRSDVVAKFDTNYLTEMLEAARSGYVVRRRKTSRCAFDDWFGISTFANMKNVWCFRDMRAFEKHMNTSWNAEDMVKRKVDEHKIPIVGLEESRIDFYILREGSEQLRWD